MRALVVEDDPHVGPDLVRALTAAGFAVDLARDGEDASFRGSVEDYAAVVLDLGLPRLDGLSVLKRWRADGRAFPVLILSARGDWTEKVEGIEAGADDYMAKPFEMGELVARFRGLIRRAAGRLTPVVSVGRLSLDTQRRSASLDGAPLRLSPLEFRLLDCLAHNPGRAVSAGELADHLYGVGDGGDANAIEALVARLRRKVGAEVIVTRRGFGYALAAA
ncbi:MAG: response regulator transcription factor [Phenylobacterium sp.]|uniref:response regulator transcription factor n=1 Tax=Phenylobacterium sp. TaxID=1871053 RepID=UPI001A39CC75|nr:response regulator transcription factor [Phenylobacterium sp.]MBL8555434.1 response regulator transcription factor [Phenylobacterium sp.]